MPVRKLPWSEPSWRPQVESWISDQLQRYDIAITGPIQQPHIRPWSTVLQVPIDGGSVFFKASLPKLGHEVALTEALYRWYPDCMPQVLATDTNRKWMLLRDGGPTLRSMVNDPQDLHHWLKILPRYAAIQKELAERVPTLLSMGVPDRRLSMLPSLYQSLLTDQDAMMLGQPDGLTHEQYDRLQALTESVALQCRQLAAYPIADSLQHDDFHDGNILVDGGRYTLFDWGDAIVSHPFFSYLVTQRIISYRLDLEPDDPRVLAVRDAYLAPWQQLAPLNDLLEVLAISHRLAMICRALNWYQVVSVMPAEHWTEYADAVPGWLQEFLQTGV
ncbi:MAG: phosphotransferase [Chloroflexota bacterium]|nr:phosphotransferase [Chloroflexota bacterium]